MDESSETHVQSTYYQQLGEQPLDQLEAQALVEWQVGDVILDLYEITALLGQGGMGKVFRAHHRGWNIDLAVKCPRPELFTSQEGKELYFKEAQTWIELGLHPHIASCYYVRTLGGAPRLFAEYVEGGSLESWIESKKLYEGGRAKALERILDIAIQFAWGLAYAHEQGLVHQDVKPGNVLMTPGGIVKVTDFGLANAVGKTGTPAYHSPEQARREGVSRKTDIWSWGVSVLEMFSGEVTWYSGQAVAEALEGYLETGAEEEAIPTMPSELAALLRQCFRQNQAERPTDMLVIANRLQAIYQQETKQAYPRQAPKPVELRAASLNNRALSLLDLGKRNEALLAWDQALQAEPHNLEATYNQGLTQWRSAQISDDALVERMREVSKTHSGEWLAAYLLGQVLLERDDCEEAIRVLGGISRPDAEREEVIAALALAKSQRADARQHLRTFAGHSWSVKSVCLSSDGRFALSGGGDDTLKLWDASSGECLRTIEGQGVSSVCLSADGRQALSGGADKTLKLWEVASGECLHTFEGHTDTVESVCLSTDERYALSGSWDETLKLWELESGRCLRTFAGHTDIVNSVSLSADGRLALSGGGDTLKVWEVATGGCLRTFEGHTDMVLSVCLNSDGRFALSGGADKTLKLWDVENGRCLRTFEGHASFVYAVCLSADGSFALSGGEDSTIKLWEVASGRCLRTFEGHKKGVESMWLSVDGRQALSGSLDDTLKLWSVQLGTRSPAAPFMLSRIQAIQEVLSSETIYKQALMQARQALERDQPIKAANQVRQARAQPGYLRAPEALEMWYQLYLRLPRTSFNTGWQAAVFEGRTDGVVSVYLSADGRYALSGSRDKTLKLWETVRGRCLRAFEGHSKSVTSVCLSADGRYALSGSGDKTLKLWEVASGRCLRTFDGHKESVGSVYMSANRRYALSGGEKTLKLWAVASGRCLRTFEGHTKSVESVCLSADGRFALSGSRDRTLKLWEVESGRCLRTFDGHSNGMDIYHLTSFVSKGVNSACLSADGRYALSSGGYWLKLWEVESGRCLRTFKGHTKSVESVCLSADGRYALSGSADSTLKLWELESGRCLRTFEGHTDKVTSVCLSTDGRYALSGSLDSGLKLWSLDWELEDKESTDWDEGTRPYLEIFLRLQTPFAGELPRDREPSEGEIRLALTRRGKPTWTEEDFQQLLHTLGCAGYGWLRPEGVRKRLGEMAYERAMNA